MEILRELIDVLSNSRTTAQLITLNDMGKGKALELYKGVLGDDFSDDTEAAKKLYKAKPSDARYKKLKTRLKKRLIDALFFLDLNLIGTTPRQVAYYECNKEWAAVKILMSNKSRTTGLKLCNRILTKSATFEFTDLTMEVANLLRLYSGTIMGDLKKYQHYNDLFKEANKIWDIENRVEEYYIDLVIHYTKKKSTTEGIAEKATEYYNSIKKDMKKYPSYRLHLTGNLIRLMIYSSVNDYRGTVKLCDDAIHFFESKKYLAKTPLQIFYYQKVVCHVQLKQHKEGKIAIEKCLKLLDQGTYNWFKVQEMNFLLAMHTGQFDQALQVLNETIRHRKLKTMPPSEVEMWKIYEAYVYFLFVLGKIKASSKTKQLEKFKLGKFLNETPIFSRDKRGMNIPILIIQILFLILKEDSDTIFEKMDAIEKYSSRYLRKNDTFRSNCFIKMLLEIPKGHFHPKTIGLRVKDLVKHLHSMPIETANQSHEIEIIPYEALWKLAIDSLQK